MDYRINNEAIVACTIAQVVKQGCTKLPMAVGVTNCGVSNEKKVYICRMEKANHFSTRKWSLWRSLYRKVIVLRTIKNYPIIGEY